MTPDPKEKQTCGEEGHGFRGPWARGAWRAAGVPFSVGALSCCGVGQNGVDEQGGFLQLGGRMCFECLQLTLSQRVLL